MLISNQTRHTWSNMAPAAVYEGGVVEKQRWFMRDMPAIDQAVFALGVGSIAWGSALSAMPHPWGLPGALLMFAITGLIPVAVLYYTLFKGLLKDETVENIRVENRVIREENRVIREENRVIRDALKRAGLL